ncbi:MAG: alpha/beta hydrolase-fold protein [Cyclobacteriaceae bacterium]
MRSVAFIFSTILLCWSLQAAAQAVPVQQAEAFTIGESVTFHSESLAEERTLNIYLPTDYTPDSVRYHVIYLLDGSAHEDFIHIAGLVQFANYPWVKMAPPAIVVGIENVDRYRDFTFKPTKQEFIDEFPGQGKSAPFISFLKEEVIPLVKSRYATDTTSTIIGQSLGGLLATEVLFTYPDLFSNYIIISPSLWWNDQSLLDNHAAIDQAKDAHKVFVGVGKEGDIMESDAKTLAKLLENEHPNVETHYLYMGEQGHANILHQAVYKAFQSLFATESEEGKADEAE